MLLYIPNLVNDLLVSRRKDIPKIMKNMGFNISAIFVRLAQKGERRGIIQLMKLFCDYVEKEETPPDDALQYFSSAFRRIINGEKADVALGLAQSGPGRPKRIIPALPSTPEHYASVKLARSVRKYVQDRNKLTEAYGLTAAEHDVSISKVRRAWRDWKKVADMMIEMDGLISRLAKVGPKKRLRRAREEGLDTFYAIGEAAAHDMPSATPAKSWDSIITNKDLADEIRLYTSIINDLEEPVLTLAEIRDTYMHGFKNAQRRIHRSQTSR